MVFTITVPATYGFVVLGGGVLPFVTNIVLGGPVSAGRNKYKVPYPNLYAVPGVHEHVRSPHSQPTAVRASPQPSRPRFRDRRTNSTAFSAATRISWRLTTRTLL